MSCSTFHVWTWAGTGAIPPKVLCDCGSVPYRHAHNVACEHGRQRRKCEVCELIETQKSEAALLDLLVMAKAAIGCACSGTPETCIDCQSTLDAIDANPQVRARLEGR